MVKQRIDINADVGEGLNNEAAIMPYLSSCNIACGGHAGNEATIGTTIALAIHNNIKIGAHPSYPDRENFGRKPMKMSAKQLLESLESQLDLFCRKLATQNGKLHHVKPHGALYNACAINEEIAKVVMQLMKNQDRRVKLYAPYGSAIAYLAKKSGIEIVYEVFADRNYNQDLTLVSRQSKLATITNAEEVLEHCLPILFEGKVKCIEGIMVPIEAETLCVHGDNENAHEILKFLNNEFQKRGIEVR